MRNPEFLAFLSILISTLTHLVIPRAWLLSLGILAFVMGAAAIFIWLS
jgi:hypothetical protein